MAEQIRASLNSQLGNEPCTIEDTEEIFWLRESDDYQSRFKLGSALSAQYRFKDAVNAFESALRVKRDDWKLWYSLSGANLTLRRFSEAVEGYKRCLSLGADEKTVAFPLGIAAYLRKDYRAAAEWFEKCIPCSDEMLISVLYWHTLACYRSGTEPTLLGAFHADMKVGHHTAYQLAVSVFKGETTWEQAVSQLENEKSELNYVIALYGICGYLETIGKKDESRRYISLLSKKESVWPCISYLAAWNDWNAAAT